MPLSFAEKLDVLAEVATASLPSISRERFASLIQVNQRNLTHILSLEKIEPDHALLPIAADQMITDDPTTLAIVTDHLKPPKPKQKESPILQQSHLKQAALIIKEYLENQSRKTTLTEVSQSLSA